MKRIMFVCALLIIVIITGCTLIGLGITIGEKKEGGEVLVYGYIKIRGYGLSTSNVMIGQYEPFTDKPIRNAGGGEYFFYTCPADGFFCVESVRGTSLFSAGDFRMNPETGCFNTGRPGLRYIGAYHIVKIRGRALTKQVQDPDEETVVREILKKVKKGTYWEKKLLERLEKLKDIKKRRKNIPRAI